MNFGDRWSGRKWLKSEFASRRHLTVVLFIVKIKLPTLLQSKMKHLLLLPFSSIPSWIVALEIIHRRTRL